MSELLVILIPLLMIDVLNPLLLALLVFSAGTDRPIANSTALIAGHSVAYFAVGFVASYGVEAISYRLANPTSLDFAISAVLGLWCVIWALKPSKKLNDPEMPQWQLTPLRCFGFGAVVNFIGAPFAIPYFAAVDQILKADLPLSQSLQTLGIYNLSYALPFAIVPISVVLMGERSKPLLQKLNALIIKLTDKAMPWLILLLGVWLIIEAIYYFATGKTFF